MAFETRLTDAMVQTYVQAGFWGSDTIYGSLERTANTHPDREALYDGQYRFTYTQLRDRVNRVAATLSEQGIGVGDVVTIQIPNWVEYPCVFFALERIDIAGREDTPVVTNGRPEVWMVLRGAVLLQTSGLDAVDVPLGTTVLLPAGLEETTAVVQEGASLLRVTLPSPIEGLLASS